MTDRELMEGVWSRDRGAIEELVSRYRAPVFRYLLSWTQNREDALDVTQEVMMRVVDKAHTYNGGPSLRAWIFTVTRNLHVDHRRRRNFQVHNGGVAFEDTRPVSDLSTTSPERIAARREVRDRVAEAIATLPPRQREVVELRLLGQLSLEEIAATVGLTVGGVKSTLHNALVRLRRELADLREADYVEVQS